MTPHQSPQFDPLDQYLDKTLSQTDRQRFESRLDQDDALNAEIRLQQRIDRSLRQWYEPKPSNGLLSRALTMTAARRAPKSKNRLFQLRPLAVAAAVAAMVLFGAWLIWPNTAMQSNVNGVINQPKMTLTAYYQQQLDAGFKPGWPCPPDYFKRVTAGRFDHALVMAETPPAGVEPLGVSDCRTISRKTLCMLAYIDKQPAMVFFDQVADDAGQTLDSSPGSSLSLHRAVLGEVVVYELSPWDQPRLIEMFSLPAPESESAR